MSVERFVCLGTLAIVATYFTLRAAADTVWLPGMAHAAVKEHWDWAFCTVWFFGILTVVRLVLLLAGTRGPATRPRRCVDTGGAPRGVLLAETGDRGGRLVYQHGVGIARA